MCVAIQEFATVTLQILQDSQDNDSKCNLEELVAPFPVMLELFLLLLTLKYLQKKKT